MSDTPSPEMPGTAALHSQALDLEALTAQQLRNIDELRYTANLMFDSTRSIAERQAAFFKAYAQQSGGAIESEGGLLDKIAIFEQQTEAYHDLSGALAAHAGELADIASSCCSSPMEEATGNMSNLLMRESRSEQPVESAGCCCGPSNEVDATLAKLPAEEDHTEAVATEAGCCAAPGKEATTGNTANHGSPSSS